MSEAESTVVNSTAVNDDSESDTESVDPFQDRRLSEVVAQMLDTDPETDDGDIDDVYDPFENVYEIQTAFIDYNEEPKNKELFREPLASIQESDLEQALSHDDDISNVPVHTCTSDDIDIQDPGKGETDSHTSTIRDHDEHIRTIVGTRTETIFGVTVPQGNEESEADDKCRSETEFGPEAELKDIRLRWSVTSV